MMIYTYNLQNVHDKNRTVQKSKLFRSKKGIMEIWKNKNV
jgi:hypothetical protein